MQYDLATYSQGGDSIRHTVRNEQLLHEKGAKEVAGQNHVIYCELGKEVGRQTFFI